MDKKQEEAIKEYIKLAKSKLVQRMSGDVRTIVFRVLDNTLPDLMENYKNKIILKEGEK